VVLPEVMPGVPLLLLLPLPPAPSVPSENVG
jgi:hypothetical protein